MPDVGSTPRGARTRMNWQDRDYADDPMGNLGRPGGDWGGLRPRFDNPMSWSIMLGRVSGITVRIHIAFLIYIVVEFARGMTADKGAGPAMDVPVVGIFLGALFLVVLLHEFGHCIACRYAHGQANEILMWPLGGLAYCAPPHHWRAHFVTVAGGPLVNVLILSLTIPLLGVLTGAWWGVALPNPFAPASGLNEVAGSWPLLILYALNFVTLVLLLFNLLPIFPLDGGRLLQSLLWKSMGYSRSMQVSVYAGYIGAILLGMVGLIWGHILLVLIAAMGGITCYMTLKQVKFTDDFMGYESDASYELFSGNEQDDDEPRVSRRERREERKRARDASEAEQDAAAMEEILEKISEHGMESLDARERRILERVTERKRQSE
ncbi:MAG: site-2 protease family protein [Planctomycetota bacterium]